MTFEELGLNEEVLRAVSELGFEKPTPIQEKSIPNLLNSNKDLIALAQTGTGKTAAFGIPVIQQVDVDSKNTQAIILCPTRELCIQITRDLTNYAKHVKNLHIVPVYGGASIEHQMKALRRGVHIVVGTPGRVLDLINRKYLKFQKIEWLVLDEADEMLSMGFQEDLDKILSEMPSEKQTLLFSATMPTGIKSIIKKYMTNPDEIQIGKRNAGAESVNHQYYVVQARDRYEALKRIADVNPDIYGIVFCRTRIETKEIAEKLMSDGYNADALHGDLSQSQRDHVMKRFRVKHLQILVATDVAARGLDVTDLTHIINYQLPDELDIYIHRSGRTGRAGKKGTSITIIHSRERHKIRMLEKKSGKKFDKKSVPDGKKVCEKQLFHLVDKVEKVMVEENQIEEFLPIIYKKLDWLSREDLIQHFVSVEFNRFLAYYKNARDLNIVEKDSYDRNDRGGRNDRGDRGGRRGDRRDRGSRGDRRDRGERDEKKNRRNIKFSGFNINLGKKHKITPQRIMGIVNELMPRNRVDIGKIDINKKFSFFEIDSKFEKDLMISSMNIEMHGAQVVIEPAGMHSRDDTSEKIEKKKKKKKRLGRKIKENRPA